jgi:PhnB protein
MSAPEPYLHFPGTAREALTFYQQVFGGELILSGPVSLFAADAAGGEEPFQSTGLMFSLLGTASPEELRLWFDALAEGGTIREELQVRPWGASDDHVVDRYGVHWLVGFENAET